MKEKLIIVAILLLMGIPVNSQTIDFVDLSLKQYLINEKCVDTTYNGVSFSNDRDVDLNNDNEIQLEEALEIRYLELNDFPDEYVIQSLLDLNNFPNLEYLKIIDNDSLKRISNLNLFNLKSLWISDGIGLKYLDVSNLPSISESLRIEGITSLDTLNIKNGTVASQFSLFYSQDIKYACIDSLSNEIDEFVNSGAMLTGSSPSFNCVNTLSNNEKDINQIFIYPNPTDNYLAVKTEDADIEISLFTITGKKVIQTKSKIIDVSIIPSGFYLLTCRIGDKYLTKKIIVK
ncbi:T9SS type A sorting domain-containing protein [Winogradskyella flava]|uniref:T9SS type A sorting domain-containing protein n=1 Tax=Winogradskyella flava TaxID=1884876 RepID=UPI0024917E19|nr:T9SS type A sorting domain-containing protein [Winogradskyella flava]